MVAGSDDTTIFTETGRIVSGPFKGHVDFVRSAAFSPDGKRVVSGSGDKTIRIWDTETCMTCKVYS